MSVDKSGKKTTKRISVFIRAIVVLAIITTVNFLIAHYVFFVRNEMEEASYANMGQTMGQIVKTLESTWTADAENIKELSSVLANTYDRDAVMRRIEKGEIVYRYLYASSVQTEAIASDGTSLHQNILHQFSEHKFVKKVQSSEAFYSKDAGWCYLYRCPVIVARRQSGWIYAQYQFERVRNLFPDKLYDGMGNCFIYDLKTGKIVYQQDEGNYSDVVGSSLGEFVLHSLGGSTDTVKKINDSIMGNAENIFSERMKGTDNLIYLSPIEGSGYYLIGVADYAYVMTEAKTVRLAVMSSIILVLVGLVGTILGLIIYRIRKRARLVLEEAREKHSKELKQALDEATAANEAKSRFLANMSHEIRTPINAVIGMNEMIMRENTREDIKGYSKDIDDAAHTLLHIVNNILDINKLESGKMELVLGDYNLKEMVSSLKNMIDVKASAKGIPVLVDLDNSLPSVLYGDEIRIRQIIMNLLTNAVKYTNSGSVTLKVKGESAGEGKISLKVSVTDTGIGIKEEDIPKLRDMFCRIEESRNRNVDGTGLGLNITLELLELMGSSLNVESEYGKGSTFSFVLCQDIKDATPVGDINKPKETPEKKNQTGFIAPKANILVVDDNRTNLKVVSALLKKTKANVDTAESGMECLEKAKEKGYNLIFMDHMMPEMDGIETFKRLRDEGVIDASTPVVVLTANAIVGAREQYLAEGFNEYMSKPVDFNVLERMLKQFLPADMLEAV